MWWQLATRSPTLAAEYHVYRQSLLWSLASLKMQDMDLEDFQYPPDNAGELQDLAAKVSMKWKVIARYLKASHNTIESINMRYQKEGMEECLMQVFDWWQMSHTKPYTWATIIEILEKPSVGHGKLAAHLRQTLEHRQPDPSAWFS